MENKLEGGDQSQNIAHSLHTDNRRHYYNKEVKTVQNNNFTTKVSDSQNLQQPSTMSQENNTVAIPINRLEGRRKRQEEGKTIFVDVQSSDIFKESENDS